MLLVDQVSPAGGTVAERLGLPFVTIANALPINREPAVPPYPTPWLPGRAPWSRWLTEPVWRDLQAQRQCWGLRPQRRKEEAHSPLLQLAQLPWAFDFPRKRLAPQFHDVGPLADPSGREPLLRDAVPFPWERLDCRTAARSSLSRSLQPALRWRLSW